MTGALELPSFFLLPLLALGIARRRGFDLAGALGSRRRTLVILACPLLGAVLVGSLIGKHWGYRGRMPYFAFPPALLLSSLVLSSWVNVKRTRFRVAVAAGLCVLTVGMSMTGFP